EFRRVLFRSTWPACRSRSTSRTTRATSGPSLSPRSPLWVPSTPARATAVMGRGNDEPVPEAVLTRPTRYWQSQFHLKHLGTQESPNTPPPEGATPNYGYRPVP